MAAPRKPGFALPVAVTLAVLVAGYVGAYYAMMRAVSYPETGSLAMALRPGETSRPAFTMSVPEPQYRTLFGRTGCCGILFSPIHWLDRRIRPHVWELADE